MRTAEQTTLDKTWSLDAVGNWLSTTTNGATQTRTHNAVNEITDISGDGIDPNYDAAATTGTGSVAVAVPAFAQKGGEETTRLHLLYDAWRHVKFTKVEPGTRGPVRNTEMGACPWCPRGSREAPRDREC
ncbi:MAG TPA: hypothetical protein VM031_04610 [Phycisphaerae bacterium]|nr:hypothetical protein [Phycisphaerae bacterium]